MVAQHHHQVSTCRYCGSAKDPVPRLRINGSLEGVFARPKPKMDRLWSVLELASAAPTASLPIRSFTVARMNCCFAHILHELRVLVNIESHGARLVSKLPMASGLCL